MNLRIFHLWINLKTIKFDSLLSSDDFFLHLASAYENLGQPLLSLWELNGEIPFNNAISVLSLDKFFILHLACWDRKIICFWHFYWYSNMILCHFGKFFAVIPPHFCSIHICRTVNIQVFTILLNPNYFKKQSSPSSFLLTLGNNTGPKWQWSTQQASFIS